MNQTNNFVEEIKRYFLETFTKREGKFGYKPLMFPSSNGSREFHEQLKEEGLIYLEDEEKNAVASIHHTRGIVFVTLDEKYGGLWKVIIQEDRTRLQKVNHNTTIKGVRVIGKIDLNNVGEGVEEEIFSFCSYDGKCKITLENHRSYPETIYADIKEVLCM